MVTRRGMPLTAPSIAGTEHLSAAWPIRHFDEAPTTISPAEWGQIVFLSVSAVSQSRYQSLVGPGFARSSLTTRWWYKPTGQVTFSCPPLGRWKCSQSWLPDYFSFRAEGLLTEIISIFLSPFCLEGVLTSGSLVWTSLLLVENRENDSLHHCWIGSPPELEAPASLGMSTSIIIALFDRIFLSTLLCSRLLVTFEVIFPFSRSASFQTVHRHIIVYDLRFIWGSLKDGTFVCGFRLWTLYWRKS